MYWTGKEYDKDGNLLNEYKNGSGHIKILNEEGTLTFEGEYLNWKKMAKENYIPVNLTIILPR